jgi:hypothetical protein
LSNNAYSEAVAPATYAANASLAVAFEPDYWLLTPVSGGDAFYSFDGKNDHGRVKATFTEPVLLRSKARSIWVRQVGGAATVGIAAATDV